MYLGSCLNTASQSIMTPSFHASNASRKILPNYHIIIIPSSPNCVMFNKLPSSHHHHNFHGKSGNLSIHNLWNFPATRLGWFLQHRRRLGLLKLWSLSRRWRVVDITIYGVHEGYAVARLRHGGGFSFSPKGHAGFVFLVTYIRGC